MLSDERGIHELIRELYESAERSSWGLSPEDIRSHRRQRVSWMPDPKVLLLVAAVMVLIASGSFAIKESTSHKSASSSPASTTAIFKGKSVVVPNVVGRSKSAADSLLTTADLRIGEVSGLASAQVPNGTVIASDPSGGSSVAPRSYVSLTVSSGPARVSSPNTLPATSLTRGSAPPSEQTSPPVTSAPPSTAPTQTIPPNCASGNVTVSMASPSASTCVTVGSSVTVDYALPSGSNFYGSWSNSPPTISDASVLTGVNYVASGRTASAVFNAVGVGAASVMATFGETCAPEGTTPCTVPSQYSETLSVTVGAT